MNQSMNNYYPSKLYYIGAYTTLNIQVMKYPIKLLASQRPRDNAVSSFMINTGVYILLYVYQRFHIRLLIHVRLDVSHLGIYYTNVCESRATMLASK